MDTASRIDPEGFSLSIPWQELLETLFRRRWTIVGGMAVGILVPLGLVTLRPAVYEAQATILLTAQPGADARNGMPEKQVRTEMTLLRSPSLIRSVLDGYEKEGITRWAARDPEVLADRIQTDTLAKSSVVEISFTDPDPEWAARFVNDLLSHHIERIAVLNEQINAQTFFEEQRDLANQRWIEARQALAAFREQQGHTLLTGDVGELRSVLARLDANAVAAETRVLQLEAKVEYLTKELTQHPETVESETHVMENDSARQLRSRILELEIERSELLSRYTPTSTFVREVDRQIEEARRLLIDSDGGILAETITEANPAYQSLQIDLVKSRAELTEARAGVSALAKQTDLYQGKLGELERAAAERDRLENELQSARETAESYGKMEEEARLKTALDDSRIVNLVVVEQALVPRKPQASKPQFMLALGGLAGLFLGTAWSYLKDWIDPTVKSSAQALRLAGVPVIAEIPAR